MLLPAYTTYIYNNMIRALVRLRKNMSSVSDNVAEKLTKFWSTISEYYNGNVKFEENRDHAALTAFNLPFRKCNAFWILR